MRGGGLVELGKSDHLILLSLAERTRFRADTAPVLVSGSENAGGYRDFRSDELASISHLEATELLGSETIGINEALTRSAAVEPRTNVMNIMFDLEVARGGPSAGVAMLRKANR